MTETTNDRVAIITGASSGIGRATAFELGRADYRIALVARSEETLAAMVDELGGQGVEALAAPADVTDRAAVRAAVARTLDRFGRIDVVVNNAGIMPLSFLENLHEDEWERMVDVNVKGVLHVIGAVLPTLKAQRSGHLINVSSVAGLRLFPSGAVYCATKFAVEALTEGIRQELSARYGIRATSIQPGAVTTNLTSTITDPDVAARSGELDFRFLDAEDVARAIAWAADQPEHMSVNAILVRPTGQSH